MSKGGFTFAPANRIEPTMTEFEKNYLETYTPSNYNDHESLADALGVVHVEFIVIHPFREGNGRVARILSDLMVMQSGFPPLNYEAIDQNKNPQSYLDYIKTIHAGVCKNYTPIKQLFSQLLSDSIS